MACRPGSIRRCDESAAVSGVAQVAASSAAQRAHRALASPRGAGPAAPSSRAILRTGGRIVPASTWATTGG
jgi:hypothetical protein